MAATQSVVSFLCGPALIVKNRSYKARTNVYNVVVGESGSGKTHLPKWIFNIAKRVTFFYFCFASMFFLFCFRYSRY